MPHSPLAPCTQCDRCQFYAFSEYLVCALHPSGPSEVEYCPDFDPWPEGKILWAPVGLGFYEMPEPLESSLSHSTNRSRHALREELEQIEAHPIFSGHCPQCGHKLGYEPRYLWSCDRCGWQDTLQH